MKIARTFFLRLVIASTLAQPAFGFYFLKSWLCDLCGIFCEEEPPPPPPSWRRVLKEYNEDSLFALLEGEELNSFKLKYEEAKKTKKSYGHCFHPGSAHYGEMANFWDCLNNMLGEGEKGAQFSISDDSPSIKPWVEPVGGKLLASNPGVWSFEDFLDAREVDELLQLVSKYGHTHGAFGPCKDEEKDLYLASAHSAEGKMCFKISENNVCEGSFELSACTLETETLDAKILSKIRARVQSTWNSAGIEVGNYANVFLSSGGTPPVDLHTDNQWKITFALYLSDGGASVLFPSEDLLLEPKKGMALTWLNTLEDGTRNPHSDHAVQAHPASADDRLVMVFEFLA